MIKQFYFKQIILTEIIPQTVLFDPLIRPYQVLTFCVIVDLGAMAMKGYYIFSKARRMELRHHII